MCAKVFEEDKVITKVYKLEEYLENVNNNIVDVVKLDNRRVIRLLMKFLTKIPEAINDIPLLIKKYAETLLMHNLEKHKFDVNVVKILIKNTDSISNDNIRYIAKDYDDADIWETIFNNCDIVRYEKVDTKRRIEGCWFEETIGRKSEQLSELNLFRLIIKNNMVELLKLSIDHDIKFENCYDNVETEEYSFSIGNTHYSRYSFAHMYNIIHKCVELGYIDMVEVLIDNNYDVNQTVFIDPSHFLSEDKITNKIWKNLNTGITPLFIAIDKDNIPMVELLIKNGAGVNAKLKIFKTKFYTIKVEDDDGYFYKTSLLTYALENNKMEIAKLLIDNGAKISKINYIKYSKKIYKILK